MLDEFLSSPGQVQLRGQVERSSMPGREGEFGSGGRPGAHRVVTACFTQMHEYAQNMPLKRVYTHCLAHSPGQLG